MLEGVLVVRVNYPVIGLYVIEGFGCWLKEVWNFVEIKLQKSLICQKKCFVVVPITRR